MSLSTIYSWEPNLNEQFIGMFLFPAGAVPIKRAHINPFSEVHWEVKIMIKYGFIFLAIPLVIVGKEQSEPTVLSFTGCFHKYLAT